MMRVVFLGNAYFGYVYTYTFEPETIDDAAYAAAEQARRAQRTGEIGTKAQSKTGRSWIEQLAARLSRRKEQATC